MFNLTGSEIIILLLLALIVLGPEKLPEAIRRFGQIYAELRKMSQGFQSELRQAIDEPVRELRSTAEMARRTIEEPAESLSRVTTQIGQDAKDTLSTKRVPDAPVAGGGSTSSEDTPAPPATDGEPATDVEPTIDVEPLPIEADLASAAQQALGGSPDAPAAGGPPPDDPGDGEPALA